MKRKLPERRKKPGIKKGQKVIDELYLVDFEVTFDDDFHPYKFKITEEIVDAINTYLVLCKSRPNKAIKELPALIKRMPQVPQLRNHLFVALKILGKSREAYLVNDQALKDHPDYIFAVINKAIQYWEKNELDEVEKLLGGNPLIITRTFPKRKVFHASEVFGYYSFLIRFFIAKNNVEVAQMIYRMLEELTPEHPRLRELKNLIKYKQIKDLIKKPINFLWKLRGRSTKRN